MSRAWFNFETGTLHIDHEGPINQDDWTAIWLDLPTTGSAWIDRGLMFVQACDGTAEICLGPVSAECRAVRP